ncbi:leucine-rich repeat domain-containing protein [Wolbachia endosymbiont of Ctenocephalides felis wCfeT]|uniref:hypothetical protein n=1 Tax=Wolbachia endosymbiont of Ctenocephalides felis wCfeT TaxID=2732593 RepID=UPI001444E346|nr:hypothetical protein [Wolbachia endosymbiont of Ctenocephalides felis wCfeT]
MNTEINPNDDMDRYFNSCILGDVFIIPHSCNKLDIKALAKFLSKHGTKHNIKELNLQSCKLDDDDIKELFSVPADKLPKITKLILPGNKIRGEGLKVIANKLPNLTKLDLGGNEIGDEDLEEALDNGSLSKLTELDLSFNKITAKGVKPIAKLSNLTKLYLSRNDIKDEGVEALSSLSKLTELALFNTGITAKGVKPIAKLLNLTVLNLSWNRIEDEGAEALSSLSKLTELDLFQTGITAKGVKPIAKLSNLVKLNLGDNKLGDEGAEALSSLSKLTELALFNTGITAKGAEALGNGNLSKLVKLRLGGNEIEAKGIEALAVKLINLILLDLDPLCSRPDNIVFKYLEALAQLQCLNHIEIRVDRHYSNFLNALVKSYNDGKFGKLDEKTVKGLVFKMAQDNNSEQDIKCILQNPGKYPFLINSRDTGGHSLYHFYNDSDEMQKFLFEHGLVPIRELEVEEGARLENFVRDTQSIHKKEVVEATNFFVEELAKSMEESEDRSKQLTEDERRSRLEHLTNDYMASVQALLTQDSKILKLLSISKIDKEEVIEMVLKAIMRSTYTEAEEEKQEIFRNVLSIIADHDITEEEKESTIKNVLSAMINRGVSEEDKERAIKHAIDIFRNDESFITTIVNRAKEELETRYLNGVYKLKCTDGKKVNIPESISYINSHINKLFSSISANDKRDLLVTLVDQNLELAKEKLHEMVKQQGIDKERIKEIPNGTEFCKFLTDDSQLDTLFKKISGWELKEVWKENKKFILTKRIYMAATAYDGLRSSCDPVSNIINSVEEIDSKLVDKYYEKEEKSIITGNNIREFVRDLAKKLIQYAENNPELKLALWDFAIAMVDVEKPEEITLEYQKILAEINKLCSKDNIKKHLSEYSRDIPKLNEYEIISIHSAGR